MKCRLHGKIKWNRFIFIIVTTTTFLYLITAYGTTAAVNQATNNVTSTITPTKSPKKEVDINFPNSKTSIQEPYVFFEKGYYYEPQGQIMNFLSQEQKLFIQRAVVTTAKKIDARYKNFQYGSYRLLGNGLEFQLYFQGKNRTSSRKVALFQHFGNGVQLKQIVYNNEKVVNVIIPLQGKLEALKTFLDNLKKNIIPYDPHITLTFVVFNDTHTNKINSMLQENFKKLPSFRWSIVVVNDSVFSRGKGLMLGVEHIAKTPDQLLFFCDIDILFKAPFLNRCRSNSIESYQVYYPMVFSLYNPRVVYTLKQEPIPSIMDQLAVNEDTGFWRYFGFGMACMHKRELDAAGGIPDLKTWGREDEILYNKIVNLGNIKPIRYPDTSMFHIFHPKFCQNMTWLSYKNCVKSKAANEGNQMQMGVLLLKLQEGVNIEGILYPGRADYLRVVYIALVCLLAALLIIILQAVVLCRRTSKKMNTNGFNKY